MKQNPFIPFLLIIALGINPSLFGQFYIDAQYRPRFEMRDGYRRLSSTGSAPAFVISQRTRLSFNYQTDFLKIVFSPQDVRVWGEESLANTSGVFGDEASIDMFEAYAEIKMGKSGWISVGRQQLVYDNQRLLASRNWNQNGIAYDALVIKLKSDDLNIHLGSTWNAMNESLSENYYWPYRLKTLNFLWMNRNINQNLQLSLLHIASGQNETELSNKLNFRQTSGFYSNYQHDDFGFNGSAYYQYGKNGQGKKLSAFLFDADIHYSQSGFKQGLGLSYLSGNKNINEKTDHLFNVLYGARHSFFGHMDYFRDFETYTKQGGLADIYYYFEFQLSKTVKLSNTGHYFWLAQTNQLTPDKKNLGYENELLFNYQINEWGNLKGAYLFYLPTPAFKTLQEIPTKKWQQFFFLELTIKTRVFSQKI